MKASLKQLVRDQEPQTPPEQPPETARKTYRTAATRADTRQVSAHFNPEVARTVKLIAVEQDMDVQEVLAEALNMLFSRYGKPTRVEVVSGRRKRTT
jgi:Antitoxin-like ribbon-helix-helix